MWLIVGFSSIYIGFLLMFMNWYIERKYVRFFDLVKIFIGIIFVMGIK